MGGIFLFFSDLTPPVYKQIIKAQEAITNQNYEQAIRHYKFVLDSNPDNKIKIKIFFQLSDIYSINIKNNEEAIFYLEKIKKISANPFWLIKVERKLGEINFLYLKNFKLSIEHYGKLTRFVPKLENFYFYQLRLALSYYNVQNYDKALTVLKDIQKDFSHKYFVISFFHIGKTLFQQGKWEESLYYFFEYIKREKRIEKIVQAKFLMANIFETLENLKKSYEIYYSIMTLYPNFQVVKNRLNSIYKRRVARKR